MPHVLVKMYCGRTEEQKQRLADEITRAVMSVLGSSEGSVSIAIEDIDPVRWDVDVYEPEIAGKDHTQYKRPGY
jgi:4-oxalocrotonate tautomerase